MSDDRGRRAVACEGWRLLPGMLDLSSEFGPRRVIYMLADGAQVYSAHVCIGAFPERTTVRTVEAFTLPDMEDPATQGCFEHSLLPAAWGPGHIQTHWTSEGDGSIYIHDVEGEAVWCIEMVPKAEALVRALEAAPGVKS